LPLYSWENAPGHAWNIKVVNILSSQFLTYAATSGVAMLVQTLGEDGPTSEIRDFAAKLAKVGNIPQIIADKLKDQSNQYRASLHKAFKMRNLSQAEAKSAIHQSSVLAKAGLRRKARRRSVSYSYNYCRSINWSLIGL